MRYEPDRELRIRDADDPELRAAAELLAVPDPPPLRREALARIRDGVAKRVAPRRGSRRWQQDLTWRGRWRLSVAGAVGFVLVSAVGAMAALWRHQRLEAQRAAPPASTTPARATRHRSHSAHSARALAGLSAVDDAAPEPGGPEATLPPPVPLVETTPVPPRETAPDPAPAPEVKRAAPAVSASPGAAAPRPGAAVGRREPSAVQTETEARLLGRALTQLRQQHDPRAAIATLDRLSRTFPRGVLGPEALVTRVEAALAMNDLSTATRLVEATQPPPGRAGAELLVMRAELRARAGRCDVAALDFARALDAMSAGAGDLHERALYGRGVCLGRLGQATAARRDFTAYLRDYPSGRFSGETRRLLDEASRAP